MTYVLQRNFYNQICNKWAQNNFVTSSVERLNSISTVPTFDLFFLYVYNSYELSYILTTCYLYNLDVFQPLFWLQNPIL